MAPIANVRSENADAKIIIVKHTQIHKNNYKNISIGWQEDQNNYSPKFSDSQTPSQNLDREHTSDYI